MAYTSLPEETPAERVLREEIEHLSRWQEVLRPHRTTEDPAYQQELVTTCYVLAWRVTRLLAVSTQLISAKGSLRDVPMQPDGWTTTLPLQSFPFQIPAGLTLDPRACPREPFYETLSRGFNRLALVPGTPAHFVANWLLDDPERVLLLWPPPENLVEWELGMTKHLQRLVIKAGRFQAVEYLVKRLGLLEDEASSFLATATVVFREMGKVDSDVERGLAIARAEDAAKRARRALDLRSEVAALKLHAAVTGLTREVPKESNESRADLIDAILRVSQEDGPPKAPALPGPTPEAEE